MGDLVNLRIERQRLTAASRTNGSVPAASSTRPEQFRNDRAHQDLAIPDRNGRRAMKSPVIKRSIVIAGHKTSVSLEDAFWKGLKEIALSRGVTLSDLVAAIDSERQLGNLSSAIRLFVLDHYKARIGVHADGRPAPREMMMMPPSAASVMRAE